MSKKGYKQTEEHKKKIGATNSIVLRGRKHTEECKKRMSIAHFGLKLSEETKRKLSEIHKGDKNWNWKGGVSGEHLLKTREKNAGRKKPKQCEICGVFGKDLKHGLCFDHDHKTGKFRGWICFRCNSVLGFVKDNKELLFTMIEYLKNN